MQANPTDVSEAMAPETKDNGKEGFPGADKIVGHNGGKPKSIQSESEMPSPLGEGARQEIRPASDKGKVPSGLLVLS